MRPRSAVSVALVLVLALALAACGPAGASSANTPTVTDAWARPAAAGGMSAAYFTLSNPTASADALLSASSPAAGMAQIHETVVDSAGTAAMHPVDRVALPAGASVGFAPGGYHLMLMGLSGDLTAGGTIELHLIFEHAGPVVVTAEIRQG